MKYLDSKRALFIGLGVLLVVILGGFAYIGAIKSINKIEPAQEILSDNSGEIIEAENPLYNIFKNNAIGYSIEYPKSWVIDDQDLTSIKISAGGEGSKIMRIEVPYPLNVLEDSSFLEWAENQEWPFSPTKPREYFDEVPIPSGLTTYKKAGTSTIQTVIVPIESNLVYINRVNGEGDGMLDGEDVYFHLLNSLTPL